MSSVELPWTLAQMAHPDTADPSRLAPGTRVGDWRVLSRHEAGTFGVVYLAVRVGAEQAGPCALKLSRRRNDARLEREVQLLARVHHANVPNLHGHGNWQGFAYVVMDWVPGVELYRWARLCNPPRRQVARLLSKLAWALSAVHATEGMHRDLKGDNVLVRLADDEPVLTDFGAGTWAGAAPLTVRGPPGTPLYYSPERLRAHLNLLPPGSASGAGPADDVYGLGVTAYRLLTDTYPFSELDEAHRTQERLRGRLPRAPHEVNPAVPPELSALVLRMLATLPEERPYVHEVNRALDRLIQSPAPEWEGLLFTWEPEPSRLGPGRRHREQVEAELRRAREQAEQSLSRVSAEVERVRAEQRAPSLSKSQEPARAPPSPEQPGALPWRQVAWGALALTAVCLAVLGRHPASPGPLPTLEVGKAGQELALPRKLPESETGAAPEEARTPAPAANAALPKDTPAVKKTTQKVPSPVAGEQKGLDAARKAVGLALCTGLTCMEQAPVSPHEAGTSSQLATAPEGLRGLFADGIIRANRGIAAKRLFVAPSSNSPLRLRDAYAYRSRAAAAVAVQLFSPAGATEWTVGQAMLRQVGTDEELSPPQVWQSEVLLPENSAWVVVEIAATEEQARGSYTLVLWESSGTRPVTVEGVTFP